MKAYLQDQEVLILGTIPQIFHVLKKPNSKRLLYKFRSYCEQNFLILENINL